MKVDRKAALKKLQGLLCSLKKDSRGDTVSGEVAVMYAISGALLKAEDGIYVIGPRQHPQADPDLGDEPYLCYFVNALVALKQLTYVEGEGAQAELRRQRAARLRSISLEGLKSEAKGLGYDLVKRRS